MKIFLIAGKAHSGKETLANMIKDYYDPKRVVITEYSKYIKLFAKEILNWDGEYKTKPRKFLQDLGITIRKDLGMPNYFTDRMIEDIKVYETLCDVLVIADIRYPEEINKIKEEFSEAKSIYIKNDYINNELTEEEKEHISEHALDEFESFDYKLINTTKEELKEKLNEILKGDD